MLLAFEWRGEKVQVEASAAGWASLYMEHHPWNERRRSSRSEYQQKALEQGMIACSSILRDWIKGQMTAVQCGTLRFEHVFMPYVLTNDGRTLAGQLDRGELKLLPGSWQREE